MAEGSVLGHERVKAMLASTLRQGRLPHAVLLSGPEGVGKKALALGVARALLCEARTDDACGSCSSCRRVPRGLHPDAFLVQPETATIKIEQIRDVIREIAGRPFEGRVRAFVIDDAHVMTDQAQNALLKSLEEPPPTSHVFLVTHSPQALAPTIRSRCQLLRVGPLPPALLEAHLRERCGFPPEEARLRAVLSGGSMAAALSFDAEAYRGLRGELMGLLEGVVSAGPLERMEAGERLAEVDDPVLALTALRSLLRDVLATRAGAGPEGLFNPDLAPRIADLARGAVGPRAFALAEAAGRTRDALEGKIPDPPYRQGPANKYIALDVLMDAMSGASS